MTSLKLLITISALGLASAFTRTGGSNANLRKANANVDRRDGEVVWCTCEHGKPSTKRPTQPVLYSARRNNDGRTYCTSTQGGHQCDSCNDGFEFDETKHCVRESTHTLIVSLPTFFFVSFEYIRHHFSAAGRSPH